MIMYITFLIGYLSSPSKLNIHQVNQKDISISFDAPFSLEGVPLQYYIEISNSTSTMVAIFTDQLQTNVSLITVDNCDAYTINVSSHNGLGFGDYKQESFILYEGKVNYSSLSCITHYPICSKNQQ